MPAIERTHTGTKVARGATGMESLTFTRVMDDGATEVEIHAHLTQGRYVIDSVRFTAKSGVITGETLRRVKLSDLLKKELDQRIELPLLTALTMFEPTVTQEPAGSRKRGPVAEKLKLVADVYEEAFKAGRPPKRAVQTFFGVSLATAGRWVMEARKAGHLGPTEERKAGI